MLDFNHGAGQPSGSVGTTVSERMEAIIDAALELGRDAEPRRQYLGASRLGVACERALQYEYVGAPVDPGRGFSGRLLRIFERGHRLEEAMAGWLRAAGFTLATHAEDGTQFGFSAADGRLQGHVDGVLTAGPDWLAYPALWESKCLGASPWRQLAKAGLAVARPTYAAQVALYQAYMDLHTNPALFTAINADTLELYAEAVPFDAALAQRMSDRAVRVITATEAGEQLPRGFVERTHFECRSCHWQERCWGGGA